MEIRLEHITGPLYIVAMPAFAALADDTRIRIVELLAEQDRSVGDLVARFSISQPAVSRHLRLLRESGVVTAHASGKQRIYRLSPAALSEVSSWADRCRRTWEERLDALGAHLDARATVTKEEHRGR
jgi:DNA-binding transcriptional ArsR family regulator